MKHPKTRRRAFFIVLMFVAVATAVYMLFFYNAKAPKKAAQAAGGALEKQDFEDQNFENSGRWYGLCTKNSVHNIDNFRQTVLHDPVLNAHFAGFNWQNASMGRLQKETWVYIHYRKNDTIFRKKSPIKLPAGRRLYHRWQDYRADDVLQQLLGNSAPLRGSSAALRTG